MLYINTVTFEYPITEQEIKKLFPTTSFSKSFKPPSGFAEVNIIEPPNVLWNQDLVESTPILEEDDKWYQSWSVIDVSLEIAQQRLNTAKEEKRKKVQEEKCRIRDGGFYVDDVLFDSDDGARIAYLELAMQLNANPSFTTFWKASEGVWVTMDAYLFSRVYEEGADHIKQVFEWQSIKDAEITSAETMEALENISVEY
jgi:hypothetical protein